MKTRYLYEERNGYEFCRVYNYTLDTAPEMKANGWTLTGTYYGFLTFRREV